MKTTKEKRIRNLDHAVWTKFAYYCKANNITIADMLEKLVKQEMRTKAVIKLIEKY